MTAPAWPADQVTRRPLADLIPYARNARTHSPAQVAKIAASIREFGWTMPALIAEDGTLIAGHGRLLAAQQLGLVDIPVMVAAGWSEAQRRAYVIADNKLSLDAGWDIPMLNLELEDLKLEGFDLNLTGFDADEILGMLAEKGENDPEEEWQGMPEYEHEDQTAFQSIHVHFKDQDAVNQFAELIKQNITANTRSTWFPEIEIERYADKRYIGD